MDNLAAYNSDSEGEPEEHANSNDFQEQTSEAKGSDFFGLAVDTNKSGQMGTSAIQNENQKEKQYSAGPRCLHVDGTAVEVPEGDFWTNLSEADICTNKGSDQIGFRKRKLEGPVNVSEKTLPSVVSGNSSTPYSSAKRRQVDGNSSQHHKTDPSSGSSQCLSATATATVPFENVSRKSLSSTNSFTQPDLKVKVYEVHPKISPYLNRQPSCQCACKISHQWTGHCGAVNRITWCTYHSFSHLLVSASMDSTVRVWNAWGQQQACVRTLTTHTKAVRDAQWSHDGRQVLSSSYDRTAAVTDVQTGQCVVRLEHSSFVSAGKFHPVTPHLVTTGTKDCIQVWDTRDPEVPVRIMAHKEHLGQVQDLLFSHDGRELFSCGDVVTRESADRSIMAWDFATGVILSNQIFQERYTVTRLCSHPTQNQFVGQTQAGYIALFSMNRPYKMNKNKRFEGHKTASYNIGVSLSQDGSIVYSGSSDGKLHCYTFNTAKRIRTINCGEVLMDVAAHPVLPSCVAGATWDGDIMLFV